MNNSNSNQEYDYEYDADCDEYEEYEEYDDFDYDYYDHYDDYNEVYDYEVYDFRNNKENHMLFTEGIYFDEEDINSEFFNPNCCRNLYLDLANGVFG